MYWTRWLLIPFVFVNGCSRQLFPKKISALFEMTRISKNILPTTFVIAASAQPPINYGGFTAATAMVHLLASTSMVVNDIWDLDADRINHPTRPLSRGVVTRREAAAFAALLSATYIYLGVKFIPLTASPIWMLSFLIIHTYTPVLKRICLIKNLSCAAVISATVPFIALSSGGCVKPFLWVFAHVVFVGAMYKELLMDIMDGRGDKLTGITTIPVLCGNRGTVGFISRVLLSSILYFVVSNPSHAYITLFYLPLYYRLLEVQKNNYHSLNIKSALKTTTQVLAVVGVLSIRN